MSFIHAVAGQSRLVTLGYKCRGLLSSTHSDTYYCSPRCNLLSAGEGWGDIPYRGWLFFFLFGTTTIITPTVVYCADILYPKI